MRRAHAQRYYDVPYMCTAGEGLLNAPLGGDAQKSEVETHSIGSIYTGYYDYAAKSGRLTTFVYF